MTNITLAAQRLIERDNLGTPVEVYKPNIVSSIVMGSFIIVIGFGWSIIAAFIANSAQLLIGLSSSQTIDPSSLPPNIDPSSLPSISPAPSSGLDLFSSMSTIFAIVFPLFGLLFAAIGLMIIVKVMRMRNNRAVLCTNGVAYVTRNSADAFRWEDVLMVFNKTFVSTDTTRDEQGFARTSTTLQHRFAVHCHDGRKIVFSGRLSNEEDLVERIEVEVARRRTMVM
jgi:hypothetical protein